MKYHYYPGCSLTGSSREYDLSTRALLSALGVELAEIPDWTCCGASTAEPVSTLLSLVLPARNIALAEKADRDIHDILVPCSACYLNLMRARQAAGEEADTLALINTVLGEEGLALSDRLEVRHLLDVLARDIGAARVAARVKRSLAGLRIAPYYGCQAIRPYTVFDDPETPVSMEDLLEACGASVFGWEMGGRCCGASHTTTKPEVGLALSGAILEAARGADAIVTVCPMCQMNLDAWQKKISARSGEDLSVSILYLPQLLGLALDLPGKELGLGLNMALYSSFTDKLGAAGMAA